MEIAAEKTYCRVCSILLEPKELNRCGSKKVYCSSKCKNKYEYQKYKSQKPIKTVCCRFCGIIASPIKHCQKICADFWRNARKTRAGVLKSTSSEFDLGGFAPWAFRQKDRKYLARFSRGSNNVPQKRLSGDKLYCSFKCKGKFTRQIQKETKVKATRNCRVCGIEIEYPLRSYCSVKCRSKYWYQKEFKSGQYIHVCPYCSVEFGSFDNSRTYCSHTCRGLAQRIVNPPNRKGEIRNGDIELSEVIVSNSIRFEAARLFREGYGVKAIAKVLKNQK